MNARMILGGVAAIALMAGAAHAETLRFGYAQNATPTVEAMQKFAELVSAKTNGDVTVQFFPDGQLGGEREMVEMVQGGALDMTKVSGGLLESFAPIYGTFTLPYLFDDQVHFYKAMDNAEIMGPVYASTSDKKFVGLTYFNSGARNFYTVKAPIEKVEDLKGLKIRVLQSPTAIRTVELLGATPVAMGQAEVYTSLQQGVLDGAENNEFALTIARHAEVAKHYSYDGHTRIPDILLIGTATLDRLTDEQRAAVQEAAKEATEFHKGVWDISVEDARKQSADQFAVQFHQPDIAPFRAAVAPIYDEQSPEAKALVTAIQGAK
ncbi:TRAP transporter substrate-binding protein [Paracoccus aestuariivivens]|uniref:DctP family TRAP transporter solute-binding subunit n=1 Tax=Paracoccus aestuariivivens TaxID=1820333 RepID=A0A6L6JAE9_9RHOB|nr:TRAP transporter substrate-binding protein [Paracoccus aestuariivivens]MTH79072.1 DctP family TRAP transporter solute-binding subunit [Paracoccus aestuariivivens]